jgi:hypothetical protein
LPTPTTQVLAAQWSYEGEDNCWKNTQTPKTLRFVYGQSRTRVTEFTGSTVPELKQTTGNFTLYQN